MKEYDDENKINKQIKENNEKEEPKSKPFIFSFLNFFIHETDNLSNIFPMFSEKLLDISQKFSNLEWAFQEKNTNFEAPLTIVKVPGYSSTEYSLANDQQTLQDFKKITKEYSNLLNKMTEYYKIHGSGNQRKVLTAAQNNIKLINSESFLEDTYAFGDYYANMIHTTKNLPNVQYAKSDENIQNINQVNNIAFHEDVKKFDRLLTDNKLIDQFLDVQNFYINKFLPNNEARKSGKILTSKETNYNQKYRDHLIKQKKLLTQNLKLKNDNPYIQNNRRILAESTYFGDVTSERSIPYKKLKKANLEMSYMDKGWPAVDMPFLTELSNMKEFLQSAKKETEDANEKAKIQKLIDEFNVPYKKLSNSFLASSEHRLELISEFEPFIDKYSEFYTKTLGVNYHPQERNYGEPPIRKLYLDAVSKNVSMIEIGTNPLIISKNPKELEGLSVDLIQKNVEMMYEDLKKVDPKTLYSSDEFSDMKTKMKELVTYIKELKTNYENDLKEGKDAYTTFLTKFKNKSDTLQASVETYLNHKNDQMLEDRTRRNSWKKQFREQPRINMAINSFDKLGYMNERIDYYLKTKELEKPNDELIIEDPKQSLKNIQKEFTLKLTSRIDKRNTFRGMLTSKKRREAVEEKKNESKEKLKAYTPVK